MLTSARISGLAIELLRRMIVLPATVVRVPGAEYAGPSGGTVTLSVPQPRVAKEQDEPGKAITYTAISEIGVDVTLKHLYDATHVTDEDLSLSLVDFGRQVLRPQISAVAIGAENQVAAAMNGLEEDEAIEFAKAASDEDTENVILEAREELSANGVPLDGRYFAVSSAIATRLLKVDNFVRADARGDGGTALESATLGTLYGFNFVESPALTAGTAVAYHSSGFGLGALAPVPPGGGADSNTAAEGGLSLRHVLAFDVDHLSTASVVSTFAGCSAVTEDAEGEEVKRAIRIGTAVA